MALPYIQFGETGTEAGAGNARNESTNSVRACLDDLRLALSRLSREILIIPQSGGDTRGPFRCGPERYIPSGYGWRRC